MGTYLEAILRQSVCQQSHKLNEVPELKTIVAGGDRQREVVSLILEGHTPRYKLTINNNLSISQSFHALRGRFAATKMYEACIMSRDREMAGTILSQLLFTAKNVDQVLFSLVVL